MSLKTKLILILLASSVLFGAASLFTQYMIMQQGYQELEDQEAFNNIIRVTESIENEIHHLSQFIYDWAAWNRTYEFIQDVSAEYIEDNLVLTSFTDNKIDLIHYYDTAGRLVWGRTIDLETEEDIELAGIPHGPLPEDHQLFSYDLDNIPLSEVDVSGILLTEKGPMMIASRPILTTESEGPVRGSLVMGKLITEDMVSALSKQTRVDFNIEPIPPSPGPSSVQQENDRSHAVPEYRIAARTTDSLNLESEMPDIQGQPVLLVQAIMERKITAQGKITIKYAILSLVIFIVLAAAVVGRQECCRTGFHPE
jgi:sensor domain CHASE-containing protein